MNLPVHPLAGQRVGYARISSASQNLDGQTDALTTAGCEKVFADTASGKLAERPELALCLGYLRAGDTLVVWRLDRLGRSLRHLVETVNALAGRGVAFASLHEGIDTTTSTGRLIFHIFAALAEFERELIAERAAAGRQAARARGRVGGHSPSFHPSRSSLPGPVMRPVTSPWPRSPGRWVSGVAPSTGRCSRRPDRNPRDGYRDSSSAESSAPRHRRPRTYPLDLSSGLLRPLLTRRRGSNRASPARPNGCGEENRRFCLSSG